MKTISKIMFFVIVLLAFAPVMFALEQTVGLRIGASFPLNDYNKDNSENELHFMAGLGYEAWLRDYVSMGIYPYYTTLQANHLDVIETKGDPIYKTQIIGAEIQARFRPTKGAVINFKKGALQRIAPFAQIGIGAAYVDNDSLNHGSVENDMLDGEIVFLAPTVGLGVSFLTKWNVNLDLGVQLDHAVSDKVDTWDDNGKFLELKDMHIMPYVGIGYTFGKKSGSAAAIVRRILRNVVSMEQDFTLDGVQFEFDSSRLTSDAKVVLKEVIEAMKKHPTVKLEIQGHTDKVGTPEYNITLSQERAQAVKDYMVANGISATRLSTKGFGENKPLASNDTAEGRALNRRIEFIIVK